MSEHTLKKFVRTTGQHSGRCSCGWAPGDQRSEQGVDDEFFKHMQNVARARAALGTRTPGLKGQRDYYRDRAADMTVPASERALWRQLADELTARLNDSGGTDEGQLRLI